MPMKKMTEPMFKVLRNLLDGKPGSDHCRGRSQFGGMTRVLQGLRRRRLIDADGELTIRGQRAARR